MAGGGLGVADDLSEQREPGQGSFLSYLLPGKHGAEAPIFGKVSNRQLRLGLVGLLALIQLFFYLETIVQSPILPGNWADYQPDFQFYLLLDALAFFILGLTNRVDKIQRGGFAGFAITYVFFAAGTWLLVTYLVSLGQAPVPAITGTLQLQYLVFYGLFVSVTEELFFRVALPPHVPGGWVTANVVFACFHIFAYSSTGTSLGVSLGIALFEAFLFGCIFYWVYKFWGFGSCVGVHAAYDLSVVGAIGLFGFTGVHLGLIPL